MRASDCLVIIYKSLALNYCFKVRFMYINFQYEKLTDTTH